MANMQKMEDKNVLLKEIPLLASVPNDSAPSYEFVHTFVTTPPLLFFHLNKSQLLTT